MKLRIEGKTWQEHYDWLIACDERIIENARASFPEQDSHRNQGMPEVLLEWNDEFAPVTAKVGTDHKDLIEGNAKFLFYGEDWDLVGEAALYRAADLCLPPLTWPTLGFFDKIPNETIQPTRLYCAELLEALESQSEDWLCVQIYYRVFDLTISVMEGAPFSVLFHGAIQLGGLIRELELVARNKEDALERKKAKKAFAAQTEERDALNQRRREKAHLWHQHAESILKGHSGSGTKSALAGYILARWDSTGDPENRPAKVSKKTIQNWLSEKPS